MKNLFKSNKLGTYLIVLTALTALLLMLGSTLAETEDITVELACESGITSANTIEVENTIAISVGNLEKAKSSDSSLATVDCFKNLTSKNVITTGKKAGVVAVAYGTKKGIVETILYQITDSRNISAYTLKNGGRVQLDKAGDTKSGMVVVTAGTDNIKWRSLQPSVATVDSGGVIKAVNDGSAIILGEFTDKWGIERDIHILVGVGSGNSSIVDTVKVMSTVEMVDTGKSCQFIASINGSPSAYGSVEWTVFGNSSSSTYISKDGWLHVAFDENAAILTVRAEAVSDPSKFDSASVNVNTVIIPGLPEGDWDSSLVGNKFYADGIEWLIIKADGNGNLLIVSINHVNKDNIAFNRVPNNKYEDSDLKKVMDAYYSSNKWPTLFAYVKGADIPVEAVCKDTAVDAPSCVNESSATKVFALSISDLNTSYLKDRSKRTSICHSWLRSPGALSGNAAFLTGDGDIYAWPTEYNTGCTRPAMWIGKAEGNTQTAQVTIVNGKSKIAVAEEVILSYTVNPAGYDDGKNINWSSSNQDAATVSANPGGTATVTGIAQGTSTITLTIGTGEEEISKSINVTVSGDSVIIPGLPDSGWDNNQVGKKITVDGRDWRIIKADGNGNLLIVSEKTIEKTAFSAADNNDYAVSDLKALMDGYYEDNKWPTLFSCVKGADIPCEATNAGTDTKSAPSSVNESSQTFVFALSVSDMNTSSLEIAADNPYWLRSAGAMGSNVVCAMKFNAFMGISANNSDGYTRPAMWIGLPQQ